MDKSAKYLDLAIILFIIDIYLLANIFSVVSKEHFLENELLLTATIITIIITYFVGLTWGLILSSILIFSYGSYILYRTLILREAVQVYVYFWLAAVLYSCCITGLIRNSIASLQASNFELKKELEELVTIDSITKLDNIKSFYNDFSQCMSMSRRYKIPLCLMLIKINHFEQIERLIGESQMAELLKSMGENMIISSRHEDKLFVLDSRDTFALILWTDKKNAEIVKMRIKNDLSKKNLRTFSKGINLNMDYKVSVVQYMGTEQDIMDLVRTAKKELEYDV